MSNTTARPYQDRARGMLVGLAVGDALGAPVEFLPAPSDIYIARLGDEIAHFHRNTRAPEGVWTDDTSMALCIADSLLECGGYDSYDIMDKFYHWAYFKYRAHPQAPIDIGMQTLRALEAYEFAPTIRRDAEKTDSAGNGAIMRLAPIIISNTFPDKSYPTLQTAYKHGKLAIDPGAQSGEYIELDDIAPTLRMASLSCRETHDSLVAAAFTQLFATALYCALHGLSKQNILHYLNRWIRIEEYNDIWLQHNSRITEYILDQSGEQLRDLGGYIIDAFIIALWGLWHFTSFKDGMLAVIRLGGDTDTNAAIYGQLAGAYYGYENIPREWRDGVYLSRELVTIADDLLRMPACPILRTRFEDDIDFHKPC